ncbi:MAG: hypothetical protein ACUZ8I_07855 [Candidatus Scalindua sp.]
MLKFVIDEDIPRSTGIILKGNGYDVLDIRLILPNERCIITYNF